MALPIPSLLPGEMFFDYTVGQLWIGTLSNGNQQIPLSTLSGITFPDATVQTTAATGGGAVASVFGRTGSIVALVGDYSAFYDHLGAAAAAQAASDPTGSAATAQAAAEAASLALSRVKTIRVAMGTIASATPSTPVTSVTWPTPFADNNYTIEGTVVVAETPSDSAATAICCIGMIQLQPAGAGFNFVVCNADGVPHNVTAHFTAIHD
jgi:hypothetical protein